MLKHLIFQALRNEFDETDHSGGGVGYEEEAPYYSDQPGSSEPDDRPFVPPAGQTQQQPPATPVVDIETIRQVAAAMQQPVPQQQQPQLTQEQLYQRMNAFRVNPEVATQFFGEGASEQQVAFLQSFVDNIVKHAVTVAHLSQEQRYAELDQRVSPVLEHLRQQKEAEFTVSMTKVFPALKGKEQVVGMVIQQLRQEGFAPSTGEEAARMIAHRTQLLVRTVDPSFSLSAPQGQQQQGAMPSMTSLSGGSGGGSAPRTQPKSKEPAWRSVFPARK